MVWIATGIDELESADIQDLWEPPVDYASFRDLTVWLIHGKKGSGKSTVIHYWKAADGGRIVVSIKLAEEPAFYELFAEFLTKNEGSDTHLLVLQAERFIDVVFTTALMLTWFQVNAPTALLGKAKTVYDFLVATGAMDGSVMRKAIAFLESATKGTAGETHFREYLEHEGAPPFYRAKEAFYDILRDSAPLQQIVGCIDDVDDINFTFGPADRILIDALIGYTFTANSHCVTHRVPLRTVLTLPSELYKERKLWGADKLRAHSVHLRWEDVDSIRALINKRIAVKTGVKRRQPRGEHDRYSVSTSETWSKHFPDTVVNRRGIEESAFEYCLRHTFYTPREVLNLVDSIHEDPSHTALDPGDTTAAAKFGWSELFRRKVGENAVTSVDLFRGIYDQVYSGVDELLDQFRERPNIWARSTLEAFISDLPQKLGRRSGAGGNALATLATLYQMGFLGVGTRDESREPPLSPRRVFDVRYSFLSDLGPDARWEIAVVPPVFYDYLGIRANWGVVVRPHERLMLDDSVYRLLPSYNRHTNAFRE